MSGPSADSDLDNKIYPQHIVALLVASDAETAEIFRALEKGQVAEQIAKELARRALYDHGR